MKDDSNSSWLAIFSVFLVGCCATSLVPQVVPILGKIATSFGVSREALGWVVSLPSLACALGAVAFGVVIDRMGDRAVLYIGVIVVVIGDALVTKATSLPFLMGARVLQGLGYIALTVAGATFVLRTTSGEHRKKAMALWAAHTPAGFAAAILLVTPLAAPAAEWRWAFWGHAAIVTLLGTIAWAVIRSSAGGTFGRSFGIKDVLTSISAYRVGAASLASALLQTGLMTVLASHLSRHYGTPPHRTALYVLAAMSANLAGALVVVLTPVRKIPAVPLLVTALIAVIAAYLVMTSAFPQIEATVAILIVFTGSLGIANSLIWSLMPNVLPTQDASGALGGLVTQSTFIGVLLGPPIFFALSSATTSVVTLCTMIALLLLMVLAVPVATGKVGTSKTVDFSSSHPQT